MNPPLSNSTRTVDFDANDVDMLNCSTLSGASNNMIKGSEFNNVRGDMLRVVLNINSNRPDPQSAIAQHFPVSNPSSEKRGENRPGNTKEKSGHRPAHFLQRFLNRPQSSDVSHDSKHNPTVETRAATTSGGVGRIPVGKPNAEVTYLSYPDVEVLSTVNSLNGSISTVSPTNSRASIPGTYSRLMLVHELGYPLYKPEPDLGLQREYRKKGVRIGDVGRITPSGSFDFLFNICYPANHPINPRVLPDGFEVLQPFEVSISSSFGPNTFLLSEHVAQTNNSPITYQCPGPEGAVLALPDGATLFEAQNMGEFQSQAARHAESWYKYMNGRRGRGAPNGSLYLVTGCIKSRNWGIGSFYRGEPTGNCLQFVPNKPAGGNQSPRPAYRWETSGRIIARMGPTSHNTTDTDDEELNQCTFLSGYKIRLREDIWESLANGIAVPSPRFQDSGLQSDKEWNGVSNGSSSVSQNFAHGSESLGGGSGGVSTWTCSTFELDHVVEADLVTESLFHPSDLINIMLLQSQPNARLAITHDMEWRKVLPKEFALDRSSLKIDEFLSNVSASRVGMIDEFGCISLVSFSDMAETKYDPSFRVFDTNQCNFAVDRAGGSGRQSWEVFGREQVEGIFGVTYDLNVEHPSNSPSPFADLATCWPSMESTEDLMDVSISYGQSMPKNPSLMQERILSSCPSTASDNLLWPPAIVTTPSFTNYGNLTSLEEKCLTRKDEPSWVDEVVESEHDDDGPVDKTGSATTHRKEHHRDGDKPCENKLHCSNATASLATVRRYEVEMHLEKAPRGYRVPPASLGDDTSIPTSPKHTSSMRREGQNSPPALSGSTRWQS